MTIGEITAIWSRAQPAPGQLPLAAALDRRRPRRLLDGGSGELDLGKAHVACSTCPAELGSAAAAAARRPPGEVFARLDREMARGHGGFPDRRPWPRAAGSVSAQTSWAFGQRGWNRQPDGGLSGEGMSPARMIRCRAGGRVRVGGRRGGQQGRGVGVPRGRRTRRRAGADLDDLAQVHDRDPVADVPHDRQVVRDEQVGQAEVAAAGPRAG